MCSTLVRFFGFVTRVGYFKSMALHEYVHGVDACIGNVQ
jgi:hypothetical protein